MVPDNNLLLSRTIPENNFLLSGTNSQKETQTKGVCMDDMTEDQKLQDQLILVCGGETFWRIFAYKYLRFLMFFVPFGVSNS